MTGFRRDESSQPLYLVTLLMALLAVGCEREVGAPVATSTPAVVLADAIHGKVPITMRFSGTAQAVRTVNIVPRVTGYINERYFVEGDLVSKGDPLYLIDPRPFEDKLNELKGQLKLDRANLEFWNRAVDRQTRLKDQGAGSQRDLDFAIDQRDERNAQLDSTQAQIADAELNLGFTRINAPIDGRMEQTQINVGNLVAENRDVLTTLVTIDPVYVIFNITRDRIHQIQQFSAQGYEISKERPLDRVQVRFHLPGGELYSETGHIDYVSARIDSTTDSLIARAVVANRPAPPNGMTIIPGQYVPVELTLGERTDAVLIPRSAIFQSQVGTQVYVVGEHNKAEARIVKLGATYQDKWIVESGLSPGERVVSEGAQNVTPGVTVKPRPDDKRSGR